MKKYLLKIALFFALMAVIDVACGWIFGILRSKARGGQTHKNEYISNVCEDDILILGSSKADHHYVPSVFEDSLGLTCYNAGEMGCGIIPAYVRYKMVSQRHKPKLVLYEVTPGYDYIVDNGYSSYLGVIRQYTGDKMVRDIYLDFSDGLEGLRLMSNMYRNNSKLVANTKDLLAGADAYKGYEPLYGKISSAKPVATAKDAKNVAIDSLKWKYMERLIEDAKKDNVPIVFIVSPSYSGKLPQDYDPIMDMCEKYGVPLVNNIESDSFVQNKEMFQDVTHLNHAGAMAYSQMIIPQIRHFIKNY